MKRWLFASLLAVVIVTAQAQQKVSNNQNKTNIESNIIKLTIEGGKTFTAALGKGDVTVTLSLE